MNNRAIGWMMYDHDIDGMLYSCVNYWGTYTDNSIALLDYWNGYNSGTPGDQILVYPGSDYGITGPIGSIRLETIRESSEDYEYMWMLENQFGGNISAYTAGLYNGTIPTDDASAHHAKRIALLEDLERRIDPDVEEDPRDAHRPDDHDPAGGAVCLQGPL